MEPDRIFLTGAMGSLGGFLLEGLLRSTSTTVHCLVRSSQAEEGMERLKSNTESCGVWDASFETRIVPVPGDLAKSRFGLDPEEFAYLAEHMAEIYHCGSHVNFLLPYDRLRESDVSGTREVIRLACSGKVKPLHDVSTVGALEAGRETVWEEALGEEPPWMNSE